MTRKMMLTLLIIIIVVVSVLAYLFVASGDSGFEFFGKGSSVSSAEDQEIADAAGFVEETEEIDIGDVV